MLTLQKLWAVQWVWPIIAYVFILYSEIRTNLSYGHPLIPRHPDKRGLTVPISVTNSNTSTGILIIPTIRYVPASHLLRAPSLVLGVLGVHQMRRLAGQQDEGVALGASPRPSEESHVFLLPPWPVLTGLGEAVSLEVPAPQPPGFRGYCRTPGPEAPCWVHDVVMCWGLNVCVCVCVEGVSGNIGTPGLPCSPFIMLLCLYLHRKEMSA